MTAPRKNAAVGREGVATRPGAQACAAALVTLPGMGPATLVRLLDQYDPVDAWERVTSGATVAPAAASRFLAEGTSWAAAARRIHPARWWAGHHERGIRVTWRGQPEYPAALVDDPRPPGVLFWRGHLECLKSPCVAVVGTRRATPDGRAVAFEMGRDLAAAGVCVVSGLALGIDGAAHWGALQGAVGPGGSAPAGVAASGVDIPYPRQHARLWQQVAEAGVVVSETAPGRPAEAWRFPARNRVIAGLCRLVVVVESFTTGGSLITAEAAIERGIDVRVVPGPVLSRASAGSNQLLYDGPGPVRDAQDVLDALGMFRPAERRRSDDAGSPPAIGPLAARALDAVGWTPVSLNQVVERCGLSVPDTVHALDELGRARLVREEGGWWSRQRGR